MMPSADQLAKLPPELQQIVKDIAMDNPDVWRYLFGLAVRRMGAFQVTVAELTAFDGEGVLGMAVTGAKDGQPAEVVFGFTSTNQHERLIESIVEQRKKAGHAPETTMPIDPGFDFTKKH